MTETDGRRERAAGLSLSAFEDMVDAYGGDLADWPAPARRSAEAIARSPAGRALLEDALRLDAALLRESAPPTDAPPPPAALQARILADHARLSPAPRRQGRLRAWSLISLAAEAASELRTHVGTLGAGVVGAAAAAGLAVGVIGAPVDAPGRDAPGRDVSGSGGLFEIAATYGDDGDVSGEDAWDALFLDAADG